MLTRRNVNGIPVFEDVEGKTIYFPRFKYFDCSEFLAVRLAEDVSKELRQNEGKDVAVRCFVAPETEQDVQSLLDEQDISIFGPLDKVYGLQDVHGNDITSAVIKDMEKWPTEFLFMCLHETKNLKTRPEFKFKRKIDFDTGEPLYTVKFRPPFGLTSEQCCILLGDSVYSSVLDEVGLPEDQWDAENLSRIVALHTLADRLMEFKNSIDLKALETLYELDLEKRNLCYYDLVEIKWKDGTVSHIPAPMFLSSDAGERFLISLSRSRKQRDENFFSCPKCGAQSFYSGFCNECKIKFPQEYEQYMRYKEQETVKKEAVLQDIVRAEDINMLPQVYKDVKKEHKIKSIKYVIGGARERSMEEEYELSR